MALKPRQQTWEPLSRCRKRMQIMQKLLQMKCEVSPKATQEQRKQDIFNAQGFRGPTKA